MCFQKLDLETSKPNYEVSKSNLWKNYFFLLQIHGEICSTMKLVDGSLNHNCFSAPRSKWVHVKAEMVHLKGLGILFVGHKTGCPQIYIKFTQFEDNDGRKIPLEYYLLRCCSFWETSKKSETNGVRLIRVKLF